MIGPKIPNNVETALLNSVIKMLELGIDLKLISLNTGMPVEEINRVKLLLQ